MKIVFVHLGREHLGLEYLSAVLKTRGHQVALVHDLGLFTKEDNVFFAPTLGRWFSRKNIASDVLKLNPDIIGFSPYTSNYQWVRKAAAEIKRIKNIPIVFGGIHSTLVPEKVISNDYVDLLIAKNIFISYSEAGTPTDNGEIESFFGRLKNEWSDQYHQAQNITQLRRIIHKTINYYNNERIHTTIKDIPQNFLKRELFQQKVSIHRGA